MNIINILKLKLFFSNTRISATRIRHSVATEHAGLGNENVKTFASQYMKNKETTTAK
jgi:hypothetical protein